MCYLILQCILKLFFCAVYNPVATLNRSKFFEKKRVSILFFNFFFMKNVSKRPKVTSEKKSFSMIFHHGTWKSTFSQDCLFFFSLNFVDSIVKMEKKRVITAGFWVCTTAGSWVMWPFRSSFSNKDIKGFNVFFCLWTENKTYTNRVTLLSLNTKVTNNVLEAISQVFFFFFEI